MTSAKDRIWEIRFVFAKTSITVPKLTEMEAFAMATRVKLWTPVQGPFMDLVVPGLGNICINLNQVLYLTGPNKITSAMKQ